MDSMDRLSEILTTEQSYKNKIYKIREHAKFVLNNIQRRFPTYTLHDWEHSVSVEENLTAYVLPGETIGFFTKDELFLLLAASWLHDIGMAAEFGEDTDLEAVRVNHHTYSRKYVWLHRTELGLSDTEAKYIGVICESHGLKKISEIKTKAAFKKGTIRLRFLCSCLRLADVADVTEDRAPEIVFRLIKGADAVSDLHWQTHMDILGLSRDGDRLLFEATYRTLEGKRFLDWWAELIDKELGLFCDLSEAEGIKLNRKTERAFTEAEISIYDDSFDNSLSFDGVLNVVISGIYRRDDVAVRELMQNSIDACLRRSLDEKGAEYRGKIDIGRFVAEDGRTGFLVVRDNGIGMSANDISEYLSVIAKSINESDEVRRLLAENEENINLIANFGIGILSCFAIANTITIITKRRGYKPVKVKIKGVRARLIYEEYDVKRIGTRIILELNDSGAEIDYLSSIRHYVRNTRVSVNFKTRFGSSFDQAATDDFGSSRRLSLAISSKDTDHALLFERPAMRGQLFLPSKNNKQSGVTVLQEGILVEESNESIVGIPGNFMSGFVDFRAKYVDLTASRSEVVENEKLERAREELQQVAIKLFEDSIKRDMDNASISHPVSRQLTERAESYFTLAYDHGFEPIKALLVEYFPFQLFNSAPTRVGEIKKNDSEMLYTDSEAGYVSYLTTFNNVKLYRESQAVTRSRVLAEFLSSSRGREIVEIEKFKKRNASEISSLPLLEYYCDINGIELRSVNDMAEEGLDSLINYPEVPSAINNLLPRGTRFISMPHVNQMSFEYNGRYWLNYKHPRIFEYLANTDLVARSATYRSLMTLYFNLVTLRFEDARDILKDILGFAEARFSDLGSRKGNASE